MHLRTRLRVMSLDAAPDEAAGAPPLLVAPMAWDRLRLLHAIVHQGIDLVGLVEHRTTPSCAQRMRTSGVA